MLSVQLPARGPRLRDAPVSNVVQLVGILAHELAPFADSPVAIYGHSMGGLIAYELAHEMIRTGGGVPAALIVSGRRPPHLPEPYSHIRHLPDDEFVAVLRKRYGRIGQLLDREDIRSAFLPSLRSDFTLCEEYRCSTDEPLSCPVLAYGGIVDADVAPAELRGWQRYASGLFASSILPGGHFFIEDHRGAFLHRLTADLEASSVVYHAR